jgi:hypothetical protein
MVLNESHLRAGSMALAPPAKDVQLMAQSDYLQFQFRTATEPSHEHRNGRVHDREHAGNPTGCRCQNSSVFDAFEVLRRHSTQRQIGSPAR